MNRDEILHIWDEHLCSALNRCEQSEFDSPDEWSREDLIAIINEVREEAILFREKVLLPVLDGQCEFEIQISYRERCG